MDKEKALVPIAQKQVEFYGDELTAVQVADGTVYIPIRPICELIGVDWNGQRRRINRDPVLRGEMRTVDVTSTEGGRPVTRGVLCLPLDFVSGFLFGLNADRVRADLRDKVIRYQRECYKVLAEAFSDGRLTTDLDFDTLLQQASADAVEAYQMALAIVKLARNQILLEAHIDAHGRVLDDYGRRLETIEADLHQEERYITESQATQISQAIRAIAGEMSKRSSQNEYGRCWGEFYRKFGVSKYRHLPVSKFDEAMAWLSNWYEDLTGQTPF